MPIFRIVTAIGSAALIVPTVVGDFPSLRKCALLSKSTKLDLREGTREVYLSFIYFPISKNRLNGGGTADPD